MREVEDTFHLLHKLSQGQDEGLVHKVPNKDFIASLKNLDLDTCYISGHSFGGATALKALKVCRRINGEPIFQKALLYDSWLFPIRAEAESLISTGQNSNVMFINCEKFQSSKNISITKHFETPIADVGLKTNVITLRNTLHYARETSFDTLLLFRKC